MKKFTVALALVLAMLSALVLGSCAEPDIKTKVNIKIVVGGNQLASKEITVKTSADNKEGPTVIDAVKVIMDSTDAKIELDAHQKLAADVNGDGQVNEADAARILQMAVRKITTFPGGKVWVFDPQLKELTLHDGSNTVQFTGILLGDVDGSWKRG